MLTYKLYYNIAQSYSCELMKKKESHVITRFGDDHRQFVRIDLTLYLSAHSCMLLYANGTN